MENIQIKMIVSGGGTGGHLFPGIAVAEALLKRFPGSEVLFVGTERQTDARVLARRDFKTATIHCQGLKGKSLKSRLRSLLLLPGAVLAAGRLIRDFKPQLVLGVGGYVTGPVLLAAKLMGVATCIHEQNSVPGMANRKLGGLVDRVYLSIPGSEEYFLGNRWVLTGNPVREDLLAAAKEEKKACGHTLLVLGGSLGAHRVNTLVAGAMGILAKELPADFRIIHQTGSADEETVRRSYEELGLDHQVAAFFDDMAALYRQADMVVSRAGATTLAELAVFRLPMLLIPYPHAADDHQRKNGDYLARGGAARMMVEEDLNEERLAAAIREIMADNGLRERMAAAAAKLARPGATRAILDQCHQLLGLKKRARKITPR